MLSEQNQFLSLSLPRQTMEAGLPMLNCLLQHTLRSLCCTHSSDSSQSSKWVYAVFWRILPRNFPPPKWDHGGGMLDRAKGNKRNWILVWEDGFCDFCECERAGSGYVKGMFGADIFFKMSHEVYNFGEGVVGKVAADNSHKWVFRDSPSEKDASFISPWNVSLDPQPRAWEAQFKSGIQTIAMISSREGVIQLGSFNKVAEDLNLVISIQKKFSYLQSIPGIYAVQRPYLQTQYPYTFKPNNSQQMLETSETACRMDDKRQLIGSKRLHCESPDNFPAKSINLGYNSAQNGISGPSHIWSIPPLLPSMSCGLGALLTKMPSVAPSCETLDAILLNNTKTTSQNMKVGKDVIRDVQIPDIKVEASCVLKAAQKKEPDFSNHISSLQNGKLGIGRWESPTRERGNGSAHNLMML